VTESIAKPRVCPVCVGDLDNLLAPPSVPDFWVRPIRQGNLLWRINQSEPYAGEKPSRLAYECSGCQNTFRMVVPPE
jgi:hypothetical protein